MIRPRRTPTEELRRRAWAAAHLYEKTGDPLQLATERSLRAEVTRRHVTEECDLCGYGPDECLCVGTAQGGNVVLTFDESEHTRGEA